jgi:hypothetical protein
MNGHVGYSAIAKTIRSLYPVGKCSACVYLRKADLITIKDMRDHEKAPKFILPFGHRKPDQTVGQGANIMKQIQISVLI